MTFNRRQILVGGAVAATTPLLPAAAAQSPSTSSHLFQVSDKPFARLLRTKTDVDTHLKLVIDKFGIDHPSAVAVDSIEEAEKRFIASCDFYEGVVDLSDKLAAHHFIRASNRIARLTRRGRGNHILVRAEDEARSRAIFDRNMHPKMHVVVANDGVLPRNEVLVFYRGQLHTLSGEDTIIDAGATMFGRKLVMNNPHYGVRVRVT